MDKTDKTDKTDKKQILDHSYIIYNIPELQNIDINKIKEEINFKEMYSQGAPVPRLIAIQGKIENGLKPLYRHPANTQPELTEMSFTTKKICDILSQKLNQNFNHVLIQLYRNGNDNIGEHADKTLDIQKYTNIVNYSIGATRTMKLRKKKLNDNCEQREIHKVKLYNNSVFVLGWNDNRDWLHSINQDKRADNIKESDELYANGERISFTFRTIATFIDNSNNIFGQGSPKNKNHTSDDTLEMLHAFSKENHEINFDWNKYYSNGFNAINFEILS
jgi:alkylated DNA repair dioxygenase AlkB